MEFKQTTILGFFDSSQKNYKIPVYQRAYSWDAKNWGMFLEDIIEQLSGGNNYFYGNILLETIKKDREYEIIDGQQRLTTLTIFMRALLNSLSEKADDELLKNFDSIEKEKIYIKNNGNIKLRPVEYDSACFDAIIVDNKKEFPTNTPSQDKIVGAKSYFTKELSHFSTEKLLNIFAKIEETELTIIELANKKDAALMFELQNNRGKNLTNMEKLKSYFMYQMYVYSSKDEADTNIANISNIFTNIYQLINDIKSDEDSILIYHNQAYINGYNYRTLEDLKDKFKESPIDKIEWIKEYVREVHTTFSNIKAFECFSSEYKGYLEELGIAAFIYPFIIKGFKHFGDDKNKLNELFKILEIVLFRAKLINSRANIQERLNKILLNYAGDNHALKEEVKNTLNKSGYWSDENTEEFLRKDIYGNNVVKYIFWRYENFLQTKGYEIKKFSIKKEQIEHISPKQPDNGFIENGYDIDENKAYDEAFKTKYLNCIGNLMLISDSHNASIGNKPFAKKLESYNKNPLLSQQAEIKNFAEMENGKPVWKKKSIDKRHEKIISFGLKTWRFEEYV